MSEARALLAQHFVGRNKGWWEPIAAAFGDAEARRTVCGGLTAVALAKGLGGPAEDPNVVGCRVEAVAAYDRNALASLAAGWKLPKDVTANVSDSDADYWAVAWARSLRHLAKVGVIDSSAAWTENYLICQEAKLLWGQREREPLRWTKLAADFGRGAVNYNDIRAMDGIPFAEQVLSAADVRSGISAAQSQGQPLVLLRALRGREKLLDVGARGEVRDQLHKAFGRSMDEAAIVLELARSLHLSDLAEVEVSLARAVIRAESPRDCAALAYVIAGTGWELP